MININDELNNRYIFSEVGKNNSFHPDLHLVGLMIKNMSFFQKEIIDNFQNIAECSKDGKTISEMFKQTKMIEQTNNYEEQSKVM